MADARPSHEDLGAYVLGRLGPCEHARVEAELATDPDARAAADELRGIAELLEAMTDPYDVPAGLEAGTFRALERAIAEDRGVGAREPAETAVEPRRARRRRRLTPPVPRVALGAVAALVVALAVVAGTRIDGGSMPAGTVELEATLRGGGEQASAVVRKLGIGREIAFDTDQLPILPKGQYYELWFVGPGDAAGKPNRISAGTFHPDEQGRSHVALKAAVDPAKYPVLAVTEEPGDGDPSPSGADVLRSRAAR